MSKYNHHSLALTDAEEARFQKVKKQTGFGIKKMFMAIITALEGTAPTTKSAEEETY